MEAQKNLAKVVSYGMALYLVLFTSPSLMGMIIYAIIAVTGSFCLEIYVRICEAYNTQLTNQELLEKLKNLQQDKNIPK
jgi:hypothetical protein